MNEKRWVATLMVDVVGSTELTNRIGAEDTFSVMQDILRDIVDSVRGADGYPVDFAGDSMFAIFGAPKAVENAALVACKTAFDILEKVRGRKADFAARYGVSPDIRIGIGGGEVLIGGLGIDEQIKLNALGSAVNLAARLQSIAEPGQVFCSEEVHHEIEGFADTQKVGAFELKGFPDPVVAFRLTDIFAAKTSLEARIFRGGHDYVGREEKIAEFRTWLADDGAQAQVRLVHGPAGIGKSRFIHQALKHPEHQHPNIFVNCSVTTRDEPFAAIADIVRAHVARRGQDPSADMNAMLADLSQNDRQISGKTIALLQRRLRHVVENDAVDIRRDLGFLFHAIATRTNTRIVFEDIHWLDAQSAEILGEFLEMAERHDKIVLISRFRDDFAWSTTLVPNALELRPLSQGNILSLVQQSFPDFEDLEPLSATIYEKSEGNPLFAEEILRHIKARLTEPGRNPAAIVPAIRTIGTLQNLIFARFDLLPDGLKTSLKFAAIIDRYINHDYLSAQMGSAEDADQVLETAASQGLIEHDAKTQRYRFSHALIRDAIIGSLPRDHKKALHLQAARIIKEVSGDDTDVNAVLAFHFDQAGDVEPALEHYYAAAQSALDVYALPTCDKFMDRCAELIEDLPTELPPDVLAEALLIWCRCLDIYGNFSKIISIVTTYRAQLDRSTNIVARTICMSLYGKAQCVGGQIEASLQIIEEAEQIAVEAGDTYAAAHVKTIKLWTLIDHPRDYQREIGEILDEVGEVARATDDDHLTQTVLHMTALRYRVLGDMKNMDATVESLLAFGRARKRNWALAYAKWTEAISHHLKGQLDAAQSASYESIEYTVPGTVDWQAAHFFIDAARSLSGDRTIRPEIFEAQHQKCLEFGDKVFATPAGQQVAVAMILDGHMRRGWARLQQAGDFALEAGHKASIYRHFLGEAEFLLTLAGLLPSDQPRPRMHPLDLLKAISLRIGAVKRAEQLYQRYFEFRQIPSGFFDADAHLGLAVIAQSRKQDAEAEEHFAAAASIYQQQDFAPGLAKVDRLRKR